jgi:hypothetical protein
VDLIDYSFEEGFSVATVDYGNERDVQRTVREFLYRSFAATSESEADAQNRRQWLCEL